MKRTTIHGTILKSNLTLIIILVFLTAITFNLAAYFYIEEETFGQLSKIASQTERNAIPRLGVRTLPWSDERIKLASYQIITNALREPHGILNVDYMLLDSNMQYVPLFEDTAVETLEFKVKVNAEILKSTRHSKKQNVKFRLSGIEYAAVLTPVKQPNPLKVSWIIIYSSLEKVYELRTIINLILLIILISSAIIAAIYSVFTAKKISEPLSSLCNHIGTISERKFNQARVDAGDNEIVELADNINRMCEKLEEYDSAQREFLQNASHEFRTPLMSIQSYAEGIKYDVLEDKAAAAAIIIDESKILSLLVEDLLYLSRANTIEGFYKFRQISIDYVVGTCVERMKGIALQEKKALRLVETSNDIQIMGDEEKLSRALTNILGNCLRYAENYVFITCKPEDNFVCLTISDDGPGFDQKDLPNLFNRFYKGKNGNFGLGLAISKSIVEKHNGTISAKNTASGAMFRIWLPVCIGKNSI